jgi:hypothetical protein
MADSKCCPKCAVVKLLCEYHKDSRNKYGVQQYCKTCRAAMDQAYKATHREQANAAQRANYAKNISARRAYNHAYKEAHRAELNAAALANYHANKTRWWARAVKTKYGITLEEVNQIRQQQNNACGICGAEFDKSPRIDHDHVTGKVRGLLCHMCNVGLGAFQDNPFSLSAAIAYLSVAKETK